VNPDRERRGDTDSPAPAADARLVLGISDRGPGAPALTMHLPHPDNGPRDESSASPGAGSPSVAAQAASGARAVLPPGTRRFMRRGGPSCRDINFLLAAYVLRGLRGRQATRVRTHLARCARCRAECEELAEVPALLDMITGEEAAEAEKPPGQARAVDERGEEPAEHAGAARAELSNLLLLPRVPRQAEPG
jgi:hypothetical protein